MLESLGNVHGGKALTKPETEARIALPATRGKRSHRAEIIYRETVGSEPLTPEEVAHEYDVPVEAVLDAIDYCERNRRALQDIF